MDTHVVRVISERNSNESLESSPSSKTASHETNGKDEEEYKMDDHIQMKSKCQ